MFVRARHTGTRIILHSRTHQTLENTVRRSLLIALSLAVLGCGAESPTKPPFGEELSVAEQVAVEAAFLRVVDTLEKVRKTADDSLIADFTRVAARLVRLQGRYGTLAVTLPGAAAPVTMRAIGGTGSDATISSSTISFVLAWEDLDVGNFTVKRALIIQKGGFSSGDDRIRYLDMTGGASAGTYVGSGTLTITQPAFTSPCEGLGSTPDAICRAGKITAAATGTAAIGAGTATAVSFAATPIAGFEIIVK